MRPKLKPHVAVAVMIVAYGTLVITGSVPRDAAAGVSTVTTIVLPFLTALACWSARTRTKGRTRRGWGLLGASMALVGLNTVFFVAQGGLDGETLAPGIADLIIVVTLPLAVASLFCLAVARSRASILRRIFDALLIGASVFVGAWSLAVHALYDGAKGGLGARVLTIAYPLLEVLFVALIAFLVVRQGGNRKQLVLIGCGLTFWVLSDTAYAYLLLSSTYEAGHVIDLGWIVGYFLVYVAARSATVVEDVTEERRLSNWLAHVPYIVAGAGLISAGVMQTIRREIDFVTLGCAGAIAVLIVIRQFAMVVENKSMTIAHMRSVDEMKNRILQAVSHELRTPLTFIKGAALLLSDEADEMADDHRELVSRLVHNCDRLEDFLVGLLDLERLTRGVIEPSRRPTELAALIGTVISNVGTNAHNVACDVDEHWAEVDPAQVERIVENLIVNAIRHTPAGTNVRASVEGIETGVVISVVDNGPGVPDAVKERIFEPFKQNPSAATVIRGTGVGLALVAKFAELHGGRAWVDDAPDGGAAFRVLLPDVTSAEAA